MPGASCAAPRRSRCRRSHRTRSTSFDSPGGECSDSTDAPPLASRLQAHVESAAALRQLTAELSGTLRDLSQDATRERVEQLALQAAQLHAELHSEWRCALLSTADGAAAATSATAARDARASCGGAAATSSDLAPAKAPPASPAAAPAWPALSAWDETATLPVDLLEPVAELDAAACGAPGPPARGDHDPSARELGAPVALSLIHI